MRKVLRVTALEGYRLELEFDGGLDETNEVKLT
jgi:hypothetical protein